LKQINLGLRGISKGQKAPHDDPRSNKKTNKSKEALVKKEEDLLAKLKPIQDEFRSGRLKLLEL